MKIQLNGKEHELAAPVSVAALLESLQIEPETVAVEVNLDIVSKPKRAGWMLKQGDVVEVIRFVGGG